MRVAIVDDHPVTREGVAALVAADPRFEVVASVDDPAALPRDDSVDVVVLDLYLADGKPSTPAVAELATHTRVLVMSASRAPADVLAVVRAGASGYVTKDTAKATLLAVLTTVASGGFSLSPQLADVLTAALTPPPTVPEDPSELLSPREREALDLIAAGFTHAQAARRMNVTKATVDTYVERIRVKLQARNKAELTRIALAARRT
ncbi:LuxR C-terminal-related transcriptional regulator [Streptomyces sp. YGL11-2]|uniref:LuxR C-terminal-related transcriptional regulator n=1 Tax=Streptomyces sp. YGL11-2 TaxID=3414028 RepID=UPI003CEBC424